MLVKETEDVAKSVVKATKKVKKFGKKNWEEPEKESGFEISIN